MPRIGVASAALLSSLIRQSCIEQRQQVVGASPERTPRLARAELGAEARACRLWHARDMAWVASYVWLAGKTGRGRRTVKLTRLTPLRHWAGQEGLLAERRGRSETVGTISHSHWVEAAYGARIAQAFSL